MRPTAKGALERALLILASGALLSSGCHWFTGDKDKRGHFVKRDSIVFDRIDAGSSARLAFKTGAPAFCELRVWTQEKSRAPTQEAPRFRPCSNKEPQTEFVELIDELSTDTLYVVEISAWKAAKSRASGDRVEVHENDGRGAGKEFYVVRLNSPLHTAEVHRFASAKPISLDQLKKDLRHDTGCQAGSPNHKSLFSKASSFEAQEVESVGYAVAQIQPHPDNSEIKRLHYNEYHPEQVWRFVVGDDEEQFSFAAHQGGAFYEVLAIQDQSVRVSPSQLNHPSARLKVAPDQPLELQWSANTTADIAYVIVQVGHPGQDANFHCVFDAAQASGNVPSEQFLANLDAGEKYDASVTLYTAQVQLFPSQGKSAWLITSYDWRVAVIERRT